MGAPGRSESTAAGAAIPLARRAALWRAAIAGLLTGFACYRMVSAFGIGAVDFRPALFMARDLLSGADPYRYEPGVFWTPYPLTAAFVGMPVAWLHDEAAAALFIACSVGLLSYFILRGGETWRLGILFSWPMLYSMLNVQWTPLLAAMWFTPSLAFLVLGKPHIALPYVLTSRPRPMPAVVGAIALAASLALKRDWPWVWLGQTWSYSGSVPPLLFLPLGPLVLLALVGWRERRAWLVVLLSIMPQRVFYDQLGLLLVAGNRREQFLLVAASWCSFGVLWMSPDMRSMPGGWQTWVIVCHYLPAVAVIARRPVPELISRHWRPRVSAG